MSGDDGLRLHRLARVLHSAWWRDAISHGPAAKRRMADRAGIADTRNSSDAVENERVKTGNFFRGSIPGAVGKKMEGEQIFLVKTEVCFLETPQAADEKPSPREQNHC